ncbi:MAG: type II toxin-antitoxin system Phd/YefM family antitoxin [Crocosphaera sp.]|nr:type II toxin-antitoxin system Phd/YefM family antitoxin [Crocosphaera sp.]
MDIFSTTEAKDNLFELVEQVNIDHLPRVITSENGDAILLSKKDWESLQETLYLQSIPGFLQSIKEAEKSDDWVSEEEFFRALDDVEN